MATPKKDKNGTWSIRSFYIDEYGKHHQKYKGGFPTAAKAVVWAESFKEAPISSKKLFAVIDDVMYEKEHIEKRAQSTLAFYEENFEIIKKDIGDIEFDKISIAHIENIVKKYAEKPRKCYSCKQCLSILFNYAMRKDIISRNILDKVKFPAYQPKETAYYDADSYVKLLNIAKEENSCCYTPILICGMLGLRPSEVFPLNDSDVHNDFIRINKSQVKVKRKDEHTKNVVGKTKTQKSTRDLPIDENFRNEIFYYKTVNKIDSDILCVSDTGDRITLRMVENYLNRTVQKYGLPPITPYGLRHTFGQMQKSFGTDAYTVSRAMGHSNIVTTTKTYFHKDNDLERNAIMKTTSLLKHD